MEPKKKRPKRSGKPRGYRDFTCDDKQYWIKVLHIGCIRIIDIANKDTFDAEVDVEYDAGTGDYKFLDKIPNAIRERNVNLRTNQA
jgi:hypothetical protein